MNAEKLKAVIYCRTSSDEDKDESINLKNDGDKNHKLSIDIQNDICREMAKRFDYELIREKPFVDKDESGRLYPLTDEAKKLAESDKDFLDYCKKRQLKDDRRFREDLGNIFKILPQIDIILIRDLNRLQRNYGDSYLNNFIRAKLREHNVKVHSYDKGIRDPNNDDHSLLDDIETKIADKTVKKQLEAAARSLMKKVDEGYVRRSPACYGYESNGNQKVRQIPEEIDVVKRVYQLYNDGQSIFDICKILNKEKVPTKVKSEDPNKVNLWHDNIIRRMLKRIEYTGYQYNNAKVIIESKVFMPHKAIELDLWNKTQQKFQRNREQLINTLKKNGKRGVLGRSCTGEVRPLSGLIYCGICNKHLYHFTTSTVYDDGTKINIPYYACKWGTHFEDISENPLCRRVAVREKLPDSLLKRSNRNQGLGLIECLTPLVYKGYLNMQIDKEHRSEFIEEKERLQFDRDRLLRNEKLFARQLTEGIIDEISWQNIAGEIITERKKLDEKLKEVLSKIVELDDTSITEDKIKDLKNITPDDLKHLFNVTFEKIVSFPDHITVHFKNGKSFSIDKIRERKSRLLPKLEVIPINFTKSNEINLDSTDDKGVNEQSSEPEKNRLKDTTFAVSYFDRKRKYEKNAEDEGLSTIVYRDENILIQTVKI